MDAASSGILQLYRNLAHHSFLCIPGKLIDKYGVWYFSPTLKEVVDAQHPRSFVSMLEIFFRCFDGLISQINAVHFKRKIDVKKYQNCKFFSVFLETQNEMANTENRFFADFKQHQRNLLRDLHMTFTYAKYCQLGTFLKIGLK